MIRPVLTEIALFLTPFVVYAIFLWATRAGVLASAGAGRCTRSAWLVIAALVLMIGSFVVLAHFGGAPPGSTYVPAHIEDGEFVPGTTQVTRGAATGSMPAGCASGRSRGCSPCSIATARRRAWSAARCATRCSASRSATSTSPPPRCPTR